MNNKEFKKFQDQMEKIFQEAKENKQAMRGVNMSIIYEKGDVQIHSGFITGWPDTFRIIMVNILKNIASTEGIPEATVLSEVLDLSNNTKIESHYSIEQEKEHHE